MIKQISRILLLLFGFIFLAGSYAFSQEVFFYEHPNYRGRFLILDVNTTWPNLAQMNWNDRISSIRVTDGAEVTIYEHPDFEGSSLTITKNVPDLSWLREGLSDSWDDYISSAIIGKLPLNKEAIVIFYEHTHYQGEYLTLVDGANMDDLVTISWNDRISSIRIAEGAEVTIYEHTNFGGRSLILTNSILDLTLLSEGASKSWNDLISSISVRETPVNEGPASVILYEHAYYQNGFVVLDAGTKVSDLAEFDWNDRISSLKLINGAEITVYEEPNFEGRSLTISNDVIDLTKYRREVPQSWNDFISSLVVHPPRKKSSKREDDSGSM